MTTLIDADALKEQVTTFFGHDVLFANRIDSAPTVDAVKVVRCKDCQWSVFKDNYWGKCTYMVRPSLFITKDDYCSVGRRKE